MNRYYGQKRPKTIDLKNFKGLSFRITKAETLPKFSTIMKLINMLKQCKYLPPPVHDQFLLNRFQFLSR